MNWKFNNTASSEYNIGQLFSSHMKVMEDNTELSWESIWIHELKLAYSNAFNSTESSGSFASVLVYTKSSVNVQITCQCMYNLMKSQIWKWAIVETIRFKQNMKCILGKQVVLTEMNWNGWELSLY
jgi:hypothetical protein